jgi:hypothetical protein
VSVKLLLVFGLLVLFAVVIRSSCGDLCGDDPYPEVKSGDGRHDARLVIRNCGATTELVTVVQVGAHGRYTDVISVPGRDAVGIEWRDSGRTLAVSLYPGLRATEGGSRTMEVDGVPIVIE